MNTVEKGNKLEDDFYNYLRDQQKRGLLVYGVHSPKLCTIHKKKKYYCSERKADVEFDVVVELFREGSSLPHLHVVFECKNYKSSVPEHRVTEFSDKIRRIFGHAAKGIMVVSSRLQSGAENIANNRGMGIAKYDELGLEVIAERKGGIRIENRYVKSQIFSDNGAAKSLKFSAYHDGRYFGSIDQMLRSFDSNLPIDSKQANIKASETVQYISDEKIQESAQNLLALVEYHSGPVDLTNICSVLSLELTFTEQTVQDADGKRILGSANFDRKSIQVNTHDSELQERFTIGHEIGHFYLFHDRYLRSEIIVEQDLFMDNETENVFNYDRLEIQANIFASELLLPTQIFQVKIDESREFLGIKDRGHGYIFVDNQPCNYTPYNDLLIQLSLFFKVSKQAIQIKLMRMKLLTDNR
ncbi:MAG: ImmA/IrrE family metallo-endopeptidase [Rhodobacteraceae bacterium]|nr:ImmA/IrrE family metallo-endopeptidase [Paracoccaceae bacterium]